MHMYAYWYMYARKRGRGHPGPRPKADLPTIVIWQPLGCAQSDKTSMVVHKELPTMSILVCSIPLHLDVIPFLFAKLCS